MHMTTTDQISAENGHSIIEVIKSRWLNPRRKRFWVIVMVLLYSVLGFFVAPWVLKNSVIGLFQDDLGRQVRIEKVEINPYVMSLKVQGFELDDSDAVRLATFDQLFINFQISSLFNWAWTFSEVSLSGPYFYFERYPVGDTRLSRLLEDFANSQSVEPEPADSTAEEGRVPRLLIQNLSLNTGHVDVKDNMPATPVEAKLAPINVSIQQLNTLPDRDGRQTVTIELPNEASLTWNGSITLVPLDSEGELLLNGLHLDRAVAYLKEMIPVESLQAIVSSRFKYHVQLDSAGELDVEIDGLEIELDDVLVSGLIPVSRVTEIQKISLTGGGFRYPEKSLQFGKLSIENPQISAWLNADGSVSVLDLVPEGEEVPGSAAPAGASSPWQLGIDEFSITNGSLALSDLRFEPAAELGITALQVNVSGISNGDAVLMPFDLEGQIAQGGSFKLNGSVGVLPAFSITATTNSRGVPLSLGQPYIEQFAHILMEKGMLDSDIEVVMPAGENFTLAGSVRVAEFELKDTLDNERLLGWQSLDIDQFELDADELHLSQMVFEQLFGRFVIHEDRSTNLSALPIEQTAEQTAKVAADAGKEPMNIIIGGISVADGAMDFADFSLPLPFATHIANLDGTISTIATNSTAPANIKLEGQVDEYGLARIEGSMNVFDPIAYTDVTVEFRNLMMSNLSPYTVQFAGREIDAGKLDLGLVYAIDKGQLLGSNDVVLSDLVLGEKVEYPDAADLPLGLAVSLLKDSDGVIKIDLPVDGDINDPEFEIGGVIWQAVSGLIAKIVTAPFRLLGNLIGIESEDLGQFEFLAGRADLTPPELEKIVQLEQALAQRPEIVIEISGVSDPGIDIPALKFMQLRDIVLERLGEGQNDRDESAMMLDVEIREQVEILFRERFVDTPPESFKISHTAPPASDPEGKPVLDQLAYATDLWTRLLAAELVSDQALEDLAAARAEAISAAFLASGQFDPGRVVIVAPQRVESEDGEWVRLELSIAAD